MDWIDSNDMWLYVYRLDCTVLFIYKYKEN